MVQWVQDPATRAKQQLHRIRAKRGVGGEFPGGEKGWKKQTACGLKNDVNFVTVEGRLLYGRMSECTLNVSGKNLDIITTSMPNVSFFLFRNSKES